MLKLFARIQIANKDIERLNQIINKIPKDINEAQFSEHMCSTCPFMCENCDFCFMIFKYNAGKEHFKKIIKKLVLSFYYGMDVSTLTFLNYYICPICSIGCKDIYNNNDCPYDYLKQFDNYKKMFTRPELNNGASNKPDYKKDNCAYEPMLATKSKPYISIEGQTMIKIINNLWNINEDTSQTWNNST